MKELELDELPAYMKGYNKHIMYPNQLTTNWEAEQYVELPEVCVIVVCALR